MKSLILVAVLRAVAAVELRGKGVTCGPIESYPNSDTKQYSDSHLKSTNVGDKIVFQCKNGFSTDGGPDSPMTFEVVCTSGGFYEPQGTCQKSTKCGRPPILTNARPTGKVLTDESKIHFECSAGFSTNGQDLDRSKSNKYFEVKCQTITGEYQDVDVPRCHPYAYEPAAEAYAKYSALFKVLFAADCPGKLKLTFAQGKPSSGLDEVCEKAAPQGGATGEDCEALVSQLREDFDREVEARKTYYAEKTTMGEGNPPNLNEEAEEFCTKMWEIIERQG